MQERKLEVSVNTSPFIAIGLSNQVDKNDLTYFIQSDTLLIRTEEEN
ncbi:10207_t:CDS:2 [Gigaspora margarita]|uniref:10207_t:CDS:1 n=1 Tax=Gigaspora margarita TaxID=4874 RepID=A0ABN7V344_GIGMA|nr:10207_t:CDS:2 [Gigaspora margarita]